MNPKVMNYFKKPPHDYAALTIMQYVLFGSLILYFGRDIFIPISFAALISFILYPICSWMERRGIGRMMAIIINVTILMVLILALVVLLVKQFFAFIQEWPALQSKLTESLKQLSGYIIDSFGVSRETQAHWLSQATNQIASSGLTFLQRTISFSAFSLVMFILIPVYAVLILYYRSHWTAVLYRIFSMEQKENIRSILQLTIQAYYNFIKGMGLVYVAVGILNSIGLLILGIPHAILFGFIAAVLTFIPYVGIIVGSLLPMALAWITYDSVWYPLGVVGIFTLVQYLEANIIFPLAVSNRLQVNTFVMLVAIFAGGILWGMAGMILFVPFVGIVKLIADHNPKLRTLSIVLGTG